LRITASGLKDAIFESENHIITRIMMGNKKFEFQFNIGSLNHILKRKILATLHTAKSMPRWKVLYSPSFV
jgi:hypothetical protein